MSQISQLAEARRIIALLVNGPYEKGLTATARAFIEVPISERASDDVTWGDVAALAGYFQATRCADWELDKYQYASDRINTALKTADLNAALSSASDADTVRVKREDVEGMIELLATLKSNRGATTFTYTEEMRTVFHSRFDRLRASLNGGAL